MLREPLLWNPDERLRNTYDSNNDDSYADDDNDDELDQSMNKLSSINSSSTTNRICSDEHQINETSTYFSKNFVIFIKHPNSILLFGAFVGIVVPTAVILFNAVMSRHFRNKNSDEGFLVPMSLPLYSDQSVLLYLLFSTVTSTLAISLLARSRKFIVKSYFELKEQEKNLELQQMQQKLQEQQLSYVNQDPSESEDDKDDVNDLDNIIFALECRFIIGTLVGVSIPLILKEYYVNLLFAAITSPKLYFLCGMLAIGYSINIYMRRLCTSQQVEQSYSNEKHCFTLLKGNEDALIDTEEDDEDDIDHSHVNRMMLTQLI